MGKKFGLWLSAAALVIVVGVFARLWWSGDLPTIGLVISVAASVVGLGLVIVVLSRLTLVERNEQLLVGNEATYISVNTPELSSALERLPYEDELGADLSPRHFSSGLSVVMSEQAIELWGGSAKSPRLYLRLPWSDVRGITAGPTPESAERHASLIISVEGAREVVDVPLRWYGGRLALRLASRLEVNEAVSLALELRATASTGPVVARNSRAWRARFEELSRLEPETDRYERADLTDQWLAKGHSGRPGDM